MKIRFWLLILFIISLYANLEAEIYHVGIETQYLYHTIQSAVEICSEGDTIYVHPGLYNRSVEIQNKSISLLSLYAI
ncbi:MAG TPA: hypothetical protein PLE74_00655 [Candidatus Cloacimonadota bacterium]|nr:hypothetical protein [Candidatus Cloacimonadota bacterium]HPT70771.1 hypothetical protein [Candidatus Cloacimonadota bacterium]